MQANLKELLIDELRDIYYAEKQLVKTLPKLAKAASSSDLRQAFESHLEETEGHVTRLEQAFKLLGEPARGKTCHGILGIVEEGGELIKTHGKHKGPALDAGLIAGGQRAEHYEMAAYGTLKAWAEALDFGEIAELLSATLDEEKAADEKLSQLAGAGINDAATVAKADGRAKGNGRAKADASEDEDQESGETRRTNGRTGGGERRPARMNMSGNGRAGQASRRTGSRR
jgi:ferritin-like metal-binding protein YciE